MACVVNYETADGTSWRACILAYSIKEALEYLRSQVKTIARINSTEAGKEVDAIETKVKKDYFTEEVVEEVEVIKEVEVPVEVIKEVFVEGSTGEPQCPWCDKAFKSKQTLQTHCKKYHLKD